MSDGATLILGAGFFGTVLAQRLSFKGHPVIGTARGEPQLGIIRTRGATALALSDASALHPMPLKVGAVVMAIPPDAGLDQALVDRIAPWNLPPERLLYLSSTSVYGDRAGQHVDESTAPTPASSAAERRLAAEATWRTLGAQVIRSAGIYGPGRSILHRLAQKSLRLIDIDAIMNRIHVHDLASLAEAALTRGHPNATWLAADTTPASQRDVAAWAATTFGLPLPPPMTLGEARVRLSRDALAMLTESRRINAQASRDALAVRLRFPTYQDGLRNVWARDQAQLQASLREGTPGSDPAQ